MNRYIVYAPHKCGSSVIRRMTSSVTKTQIIEETDNTIQTDTNEAKLRFTRNLNFDEINEDDHLICIPRNPISMSISAYYSFGYTHNQPRFKSDEEWSAQQNHIRQMGLEMFVEKRIGGNCRKIRNIIHCKHRKKIIIPYELMIANFNDFLKKYLDAIDMSESFHSAYSKWSGQFTPIEDQSDLIESGTVKTHKRTTDINEWQKKLDPTNLQDILQRFHIIKRYIELVSKYDM